VLTRPLQLTTNAGLSDPQCQTSATPGFSSDPADALHTRERRVSSSTAKQSRISGIAIRIRGDGVVYGYGIGRARPHAVGCEAGDPGIITKFTKHYTHEAWKAHPALICARFGGNGVMKVMELRPFRPLAL
jgi:hypothetical protein